MNKTKYRKGSTLFLIAVSVLIGIVFWLIIAAVLTWLILSAHISKQIGIGIIPLLQGIVAFVTTIIAHIVLKGNSAILPALTPLICLFIQFVFSLLLWTADLGALLTGMIATACGAVLAYVMTHMKKKSKIIKHFGRYSR